MASETGGKRRVVYPIFWVKKSDRDVAQGCWGNRCDIWVVYPIKWAFISMIILAGRSFSLRKEMDIFPSFSFSKRKNVFFFAHDMRTFWLNILRDFGVTRTQPTLVCEDNLASMAMSVNPVQRKYSRHIDIRRHYIRELCLGNLVKLVPLRTNLMVADALAESLSTPGLEHHCSVIASWWVTLISMCVFCTRSAVANCFACSTVRFSTDYFA